MKTIGTAINEQRKSKNIVGLWLRNNDTIIDSQFVVPLGSFTHD
jgi:hypothetical protein